MVLSEYDATHAQKARTAAFIKICGRAKTLGEGVAGASMADYTYKLLMDQLKNHLSSCFPEGSLASSMRELQVCSEEYVFAVTAEKWNKYSDEVIEKFEVVSHHDHDALGQSPTDFPRARSAGPWRLPTRVLVMSMDASTHRSSTSTRSTGSYS